MPHLPPAIELTLRPERRRQGVQPAAVDLRVVVLVGIGLWVAAGAAFGVLALATDLDVTAQLLVCAAGLSLGLLGLVWEHSNRRRYRTADGSSETSSDGSSTTSGDDDAPGR